MGVKNVPSVIPPKLLYALSAMGHGNDIVLADIHFPSAALCKNGQAEEIRCDGVTLPVMLEAILKLLPLDTYASPAAVMDPVAADKQGGDPPIWSTYQKLIVAAEKRPIELEKVERFQFYERAENAFCIVHTGETAKYGNLILKKGLVDYSFQTKK